MYIAFAAIWAKLVFEALGASTHFFAWAATTLTTLALSAWVTLSVVQVALRSEKFDMYGRPAYGAIQSEIRILCFYICERILRPSDESNLLLNSIYSKTMNELPQLMDELEKMLIKLSNDVANDREGSLTKMEIRNFYKILDNWWSTMEPMLVAAGANALRRENVQAINTYRHNIIFWLKGIEDILEDNGIEMLFINCITQIIKLNKNFYNSIIEEIESLG